MKQWYALRSRTKKESLAASLLSRVSVEVYLPQIKVKKGHGKPLVTEVFFPGYLFANLDPLLGEIRLAHYCPGVRYVLGHSGQPWPIPDSVIVSLRDRVARQNGEGPPPDLSHGARVVITSGPLQDMEAIFDRHLSASGRVRVLIQMLENLWRVELGIEQLRWTARGIGVD